MVYPTRFNGYYVGTDGTVWTHWTMIGKIGELRKVKPSFRGGVHNNDRYLAVNISLKSDDGKYVKQIKYYCHRLVAETLVPNPNDYTEINHIDRNKLNNNIQNLEWTTRKDNMNHIKESIRMQNDIFTTRDYLPLVDRNAIPLDWNYDRILEQQTKPPPKVKYKILDIIDDKEYSTNSIWKWTHDNWERLEPRHNNNIKPKTFCNALLKTKITKNDYLGFKLIFLGNLIRTNPLTTLYIGCYNETSFIGELKKHVKRIYSKTKRDYRTKARMGLR